MEQIGQAFYTGAGMLWKALWALIFGYIISSAIQVLVTREQMAKILGRRGLKEASLAGMFGFISSSCSFAALAAARSVWVKGAKPVNAIAFLVASVNLVIELGIVLFVLLGWHFVVGNFLLGALMVAYAYLLTSFWFPQKLAEKARQHAEHQQKEAMQHAPPKGKNWRETIGARAGWQAIGQAFFMEWKMVYKEILFGFTVAGFISVFVPKAFWNALFLHTGGGGTPGFLVVLENALIAPVIAFFTFIGSMGNVPLAAMLWSNNASFGGVMSFLGADLVAATVIYIHAKYYGWKYTAYMSLLLYICMVAAGLTVHYLFALGGILPTHRPSLQEMVRFKVDYTLWLNLIFLLIGAWLVWFQMRGGARKSR